MKFDIIFVPSAEEDLDYYESRVQRIILHAVEKFLETDAEAEGKMRKRLRPNPLAPWELRIGEYRVFYEIRGAGLVRVLAVGHKVQNELLVRGRRVEI